VSYGRIIRDDEGNVVDIILDEDDKQEEEEGDGGQRPLNDEEEVFEPEPVEAKTDVVRALEELSASAQPAQHHTSTSERTWLKQLVQKHGDDYGSMVRDRKLNVWQNTEGEIRRLVKKAGGVEKLRE